MGLTFADLDEIDMGMALDLFVERGNDKCSEWERSATEADVEAW